jgi:hypothetical protein
MLGQIRAMSLLLKIMDFVFGAVVIGAAPVITFELLALGVLCVGVRFLPNSMVFGGILFAVEVLVALTVLFFTIRWRKKNRPSMWLAETLVGLAVSGPYFLFLSFIWAWSEPSWGM